MTLNNSIDLSVVIVTWNCRQFLSPCVTSIEEHSRGISFEIILIDNKSSDGSRELIESAYSHCAQFLNSRNVGFARACNQGLEIARGRHVLFLNPDTKVVSGALPGMVKFLDTRPEYAAVGCRLINPDQTIQMTGARAFPTPFNQFCHFTLLTRLFPRSRFFASEDLLYWDHRDSRDVDVVSGACLMVRGETIRMLEGFDEGTFLYAEEVDLCYRLKQQNFKVFYLASESIYHFGGSSTSQNNDPWFVPVLLRQAHFHFFRKHFGVSTALRYRIAVAFGCVLRLLILALSIVFAAGDDRRLRSAQLNSHLGVLLWSIGTVRR